MKVVFKSFNKTDEYLPDVVYHCNNKMKWLGFFKLVPLVCYTSLGVLRDHGQRSLAGHCPWGHKESDMTERLSTAQETFILFRDC